MEAERRREKDGVFEWRSGALVQDEEPRRARAKEPRPHLCLHFLIAQTLHADAAVNGERPQVGCTCFDGLGPQPDHKAVGDWTR